MKTPYAVTRWVHQAWQHKGWVSTLLLPLSWIVALAIRHKQRRPRTKPALANCPPIVVIGNLVAGGTGKTPVVIAVAQALALRGWQPGVISRGYGARLGEHARSGSGALDPALFGDEPALISRATGSPIAVHPQRVKALETLLADYPHVDVVLSDDGLQHQALPRTVEIVVQDARGIGNGRLLPAGPLREPASRLETVDFIITNLSAGQPAPQRSGTAPTNRSVLMRLTPDSATHLVTGRTMPWPQWLEQHGTVAPVDAVAAIGQPDRFFSMLRYSGLTLNTTVRLPDHDAYADSPFQSLTSPVILITAKDAVKCTRFQDTRLWVVNATPVFSNPGWLDELETRLCARIAKNPVGDSTLEPSNT